MNDRNVSGFELRSQETGKGMPAEGLPGAFSDENFIDEFSDELDNRSRLAASEQALSRGEFSDWFKARCANIDYFLRSKGYDGARTMRPGEPAPTILAAYESMLQNDGQQIADPYLSQLIYVEIHVGKFHHRQVTADGIFDLGNSNLPVKWFFSIKSPDGLSVHIETDPLKGSIPTKNETLRTAQTVDRAINGRQRKLGLR